MRHGLSEEGSAKARQHFEHMHTTQWRLHTWFGHLVPSPINTTIHGHTSTNETHQTSTRVMTISAQAKHNKLGETRPTRSNKYDKYAQPTNQPYTTISLKPQHTDNTTQSPPNSSYARLVFTNAQQ